MKWLRWTNRWACLGMCAALILASLALPARADDPGPVSPEARLQIFIHHFFIADDGDWHSSGEIRVAVAVSECEDAVCNETKSPLVQANLAFSADSGTLPVLNRVIPGGGDTMDHGTTVPFGLPLASGKRYGLFFTMSEADGFTPFPGYESPATNSLALVLGGPGGWSLGRHERPLGTAANEAHGRVNFTVRYADLPDLVPVSITTLDIPGSTDHLACVGVQNRGTETPGPFQVAVLLKDPPVPLGSAQAGTLAPGAAGELCARVALPQSGLHTLVAIVDPPRGIIEQNEQNNYFEQRLATLGSVAGASIVAGSGTGLVVAPSTTGGEARLTVESIRVQGKDPDGQNDCDPGANEVRVAISNAGTAASANFRVTLEVDNDDEGQKSLPALGPGARTEAIFTGISLKKGEHRLKATLDVGQSSGASTDDLEKSVRVNCKEED